MRSVKNYEEAAQGEKFSLKHWVLALILLFAIPAAFVGFFLLCSPAP